MYKKSCIFCQLTSTHHATNFRVEFIAFMSTSRQHRVKLFAESRVNDRADMTKTATDDGLTMRLQCEAVDCSTLSTSLISIDCSLVTCNSSTPSHQYSRHPVIISTAVYPVTISTAAHPVIMSTVVHPVIFGTAVHPVTISTADTRSSLVQQYTQSSLVHQYTQSPLVQQYTK